MEEVNSEFVREPEKPHLIKMVRSETYKQPLLPEVDHALRKLEEQLSLDDDDDGGGGYIYSEEKLHPSCNQNEKSEDLGILNHETWDFSQEALDSLLDQLKHEVNDHVEEGGQQDGSRTLEIVKSPGMSCFLFCS